ncbi:MAG: phosphatase PAP2 family protein [Melioribacteraceae bacterium]|nr:phosphatase PAP2 family protein [Melioribacteraceae bacterium]MDD3557392.1 phosphatase PAP2 family protein [Melioribacteraceae bacterium]
MRKTKIYLFLFIAVITAVVIYLLSNNPVKKSIDTFPPDNKSKEITPVNVDTLENKVDSAETEVKFVPPSFSGENEFGLMEGYDVLTVFLPDLIDNYEEIGDVRFFVRQSRLPVQLLPNGNLKIFPMDDDWCGKDTISFGVINQIQDYYVHKIYVDITPVNDPPKFYNLPAYLEFDEDKSLDEFRLIDFVIDIDTESSYLVFDFEKSNELTITQIGNGVFSISSKNENWYGSDTLQFLVSDDSVNFVSKKVEVNVNPVNDPPIVYPISSQTIFTNQNFSPVHLDDFVKDPDNDKIKWLITGNKFITSEITSENIALFEYPEVWRGSDTLIFIAEDKGGLKATTSAVFTVKELEFWDKQPQKDIKTLASMAVEDAVSLVITPYRWDAEDWFIFAGVLGGTAALFSLDKEIRKIGMRNSHLKDTPLIEAGELFGRGSTAYLISGAVAGAGLIAQNKKILLIGLELFESYWVANTMTSTLKGLFGRSRPYASEDNFDFYWTDYEGSGQRALPSGHATVAFSMSSVLAAHVDEWYWKAAFFTPAVLTVSQRIISNSHWISDTFFGAAIGYFIGTYFVNRHKGALDDTWVIGVDPMGRLNIVYNLN